MAKQFDNPANIKAHRKTGKEIYDALDGNIDVLVAGAGSGGTIIGIASYLKEKNPNIKIVLSDPIGSILGGGEEGVYKAVSYTHLSLACTHLPSAGIGAGPWFGPFASTHISVTSDEYIIVNSPSL